MGRATAPEKAERLNRARTLLQQFDYLPDAVARMVKLSGISRRQAYRYLQQAQFLVKPVPVGDRKVAFTVKLSRELVQRLRAFANRTDLSLSEIVSRALHAALPQRRRRG
jgi:predicted DNA-binding transcriptional regulator AlpA